MAAQDNDLDEKPLDPAVERVRRKMVRLLAISIGIMMVGLMAVLATIVYKITSRQSANESPFASPDGRTESPPSGLEGRIRLPEGAQILSSDLDGANILIRLKLATGTEQLLIYSLSEDRIIAKVAIE